MAATETVTLSQVDDWLKNLPAAQFDFTKALGLCSIAIASSTKENFRGSHSPEGMPWLPLARPRINSKGSDKPLRDNGPLMASVTVRNAAGNVETITPTRLEFGTNLEYAGTHQYGATIFPTKSKYLAIPITKQAKQAGSPRNFAGLTYAWAKGPKLRGKLVEEVDTAGKRSTKRGKKGDRQQVELTKQKGKKGLTAAITHYLLLSSVTVPARPFLGWNEELTDEVGSIIADQAAKQLMDKRIAP